MRIIAGKWRGRILQAPTGLATRPTADRVRETLFSMLASRIGSFENLRVADLFAGSGALGFEALSRGAAHALFVDNNPQALDALRKNAKKLEASAEIIGSSALQLRKSEPFDLIFADPPYTPGSGTQLVAAVLEAQLLAAGGWLSVETQRQETVVSPDLPIEAVRDVGRARLTLLRRP